MAGAHAAGARVGMDQLLRALGRLVQRRELGPQKLEVAHRFPLQDFPATTLLRANMTEPALGLQARGRTLHRAQSATDEVGHLRKRKFRLTPQQGQYLVGSPLDRKSTRLNPVTNAHLVCRLLLEKKKTKHQRHSDTHTII